MTPGLIKMWLSFIAMGLMVLAAGMIMFGRFKLKGIFRFMLSFVAYIILLFSTFLMIIVIM
ncbi:uncharacterized protein DUF2768 [Scopulibacillus darangshiensis]|uniref:Uncharacterized protein DUF2768 n=1 Tax=Scopulibacillus darangshiensis TaxID=442528 RepID=A0A4R2PBH1_9BACL|nr:DUF2768 domain-containing protein [Scopulibacillus darangshiensis]TCP31654.1 uncharacterized protein DUF2768 [Scopulibacillus darangshiensis]